MKKIFNIYFLEVILLLLIGLIPLLWYKPGYIALGHDMGFPLAPTDYFKDRLFSWTDRISSFGSNQTESIAGVFIHGLEASFFALGLPLAQAQMLSFMFWLVLPGLTMYILLRSLYPEKDNYIIRLSGSVFYALNHYLLQGWMIAERTKFSIVAALPIVILLIINVVYKGKSILQNSILLAFTLFFLNGGAGIPLWGGLMAAAVVALIVLFRQSDFSLFRKIKRASLFVFLSFTFVFLLNLYWVYPYLKSFNNNFTVRAGASGGGEGAASWSSEISKYASFTNIVKLQGIPDWYDNRGHPYAKEFFNNPGLIFLSILFPAIGFVGLLKIKTESKDSRTYKVFFLVLLLIGIPLTAGSHPPFGAFYDLALRQIPGFLIFRTPFLKFGMVVWFAFAFLMALGLKGVTEFITSRFSPRKLWQLQLSIVAIFILLVCIYNYPFFTGSFFNWSPLYSTMVKVPDYVFDAKNELDSNKFSTRVLMLPNVDWRKQTDSYDWRYYSLTPIPSILDRHSTIINDVTLQGEEGSFVKGIYDQLRSTGKSNLLNYTGVDRLILREDFYSPSDMDYIPVFANNNLKTSPQFRLSKNTGRWTFFDLSSNNVLPRIYTAKSISNVFVDTEDLDVGFNFPDLQSTGDVFVLTNFGNPYYVDGDKVYRYVMEGKCSSCTNDRPVDLSKQAPPRILPTNKLYFVAKFISDFRMNQLSDPSQKIDFILGMMAKNAAAVNYLIRDEKNEQIVKGSIENWEDSLDEIRSYYSKIDNQDTKKQSGKRIYKYLWAIMLKMEEWRLLNDGSSNNELLESLETHARAFLVELDALIERPKALRQVDVYQYKIDIPRSGMYQLGIYGDIDMKTSEEKDTTSEKKPKYEISLNDNQIGLEKVGQNEKWLRSQGIQLASGENTLIIPYHSKSSTSVQTIRLDAAPAQSTCKDIDIDNFNSQNKYHFKFIYRSPDRRPLIAKVIEKNSSLKDTPKKVYVGNRDKLEDALAYDSEFAYLPSRQAQAAAVRFCIDSDYSSGSTGEVENLEIEATRPDPLVFAYSIDQNNEVVAPKLEYVALNQTKYLIRLSSLQEGATMVFNTRRDGNWKLRQVDASKANEYFKGEKKIYLDGRVTEFERQDDHILTDFIFPRTGKDIQPSNWLANSFGSVWNLDSTSGGESNGEKVFLLEYQVQNDIYIVSVVSILSAIMLLVLYLTVRHYEKNS